MFYGGGCPIPNQKSEIRNCSADGRVVKYTYDAAGTKLTMATTISGVTTPTDYVNGFVYTNGNLAFFGSPEGRVVKNGSNYEYQYAIADHQGNTRVVFTGNTPTAQVVTTDLETATNNSFNSYPSGGTTGGIRSSLNLFDHTDPGSTFTYSNLLNAGYNSQVGVAKSYKVYPGDKIKIEAYGKYSNPSSTNGNLPGFATALLGAFGLSQPAAGEVGTQSAGVNTWGGLVAGGNGGFNNSGPKAGVTILILDKDFNYLGFVPDQIDAGAEQIGVTPVVAHDYMSAEYTVEEAGYVYAYVSNVNATQVDVYFDDITITYTPTNVIQYNEYYPFGLQTANSWTRDNNSNNFLYNEGSEMNATSGLYDLPFRNYDAALGRFFQVDPLSHMDHDYSPFAYGRNNPIVFNDPSGLMVPAQLSTWSNAQQRTYYYRNVYNSSDYLTFESWQNDNGLGGGGPNGGGGAAFGSGGYSAVWVPHHNPRYDGNDDSPLAVKRTPGHWVTTWLPTRGEDFNSPSSNYSPAAIGGEPRTGGPAGATKKPVKGSTRYNWYEFFADHNPGGDFLYEVNKFNPIAQVANSVNAFFTGKDLYGANMSDAEASINLAMAIPIFKLGKVFNILGSTGRVVANNLAEELAMQEIIMNPALAQPITRLGPMTDQRWLGWTKMQYIKELFDGTKINIHFVAKIENGIITAVDDFKFK